MSGIKIISYYRNRQLHLIEAFDRDNHADTFVININPIMIRKRGTTYRSMREAFNASNMYEQSTLCDVIETFPHLNKDPEGEIYDPEIRMWKKPAVLNV